VLVCAMIAIVAACGPSTEAPTAVVTPPPVIAVQAATKRLPRLNIVTDGLAPVLSKLVYITGSASVTDSNDVTTPLGTLEIRGRGNSTWDLFPKKPYRLRFGTSASLLGMPANRHWVLLANYSDKTMLRNDITFELSRMMGMAWTPRARFVDVQLNNQYAGVYQLVEHIRIGSDRVNITAIRASDTTAAAITGGYMLEVDERRGEDFCFNSTMTRMVWCVGDPESLRDVARTKQRAYITNYIARTDTSIMGSRFTDPDVGYASFIDVESAVNYYILQETVKNVDGDLRFGGFMFKPRGGKLTFGPVWDFDLAMGNVNYYGADRTDGWYSRNAQWFTRLFQDPAFKSRVQARWREMQAAGTLDSLQRLVYSRANYLSIVQVQNFERWPILGTWVWPNRVVTGSYTGEATALHLWLAQRLEWINANIGR
jgi:hypothetical protein